MKGFFATEKSWKLLHVNKFWEWSLCIRFQWIINKAYSVEFASRKRVDTVKSHQRVTLMWFLILTYAFGVKRCYIFFDYSVQSKVQACCCDTVRSLIEWRHRRKPQQLNWLLWARLPCNLLYCAKSEVTWKVSLCSCWTRKKPQQVSSV